MKKALSSTYPLKLDSSLFALEKVDVNWSGDKIKIITPHSFFNEICQYSTKNSEDMLHALSSFTKLAVRYAMARELREVGIVEGKVHSFAFKKDSIQYQLIYRNKITKYSFSKTFSYESIAQKDERYKDKIIAYMWMMREMIQSDHFFPFLLPSNFQAPYWTKLPGIDQVYRDALDGNPELEQAILKNE